MERIHPNLQWVDNRGKLTREAYLFLVASASSPVGVAEYAVASVPAAGQFDNHMIIVSNESGGRTLATSDGTNWRRVSDGAIIS